MGKKKKPKIEVELTSLDEWIAIQEEIHKNDPKPEKTPEQLKEEEAEKIKFAKFNKKQKASFLQTKANEYRDQMAIKYAAWKKIEAERKERLRIALENREIIEFKQASTRIVQLQETMSKIQEMEQIAWNFESEDVHRHEWNLYVTCYPLPYPEHVQNMNAYIEYWKESKPDTWSLDNAIERSEAVMYFLAALDHHILKPLNATKSQIHEWKLIMQNLKLMLQKNINYGTYYILKDVYNRMELSEDVRLATFQRDTQHFSLALWTKLKLPIPLPNPYETAATSLLVKFVKPKGEFTFPPEIDLTNVSIRILQLEYDHQSWLSESFADPDCPEVFENNFFEYLEQQWAQKQKIKYRRRFRKTVEVSAENPVESIVEDDSLSDDQIINQRWTYDRDIAPVPSDLMDYFASDICDVELQRCKIRETKNVFNLRRYLIVGCTNHINLFMVPPQPKRLMMDVTETAFQIPKKLIEFPYFVKPVELPSHKPDQAESTTKQTDEVVLLPVKSKMDYSKSKISIRSKSRSGLHKKSMMSTILAAKEEEDEDMSEDSSEFVAAKISSSIQIDRQASLERMVHVKMDMPQNVYWIDKPTLCYWDPVKNHWTTENIYECEIDEYMKTVTFRIGQFGMFGFLINRHSCYPFKWWTMYPRDSDTIVFTLETSLFTFKIAIQSNKFCLEEIEGIEEAKTKQWGILGIYFHMHELIGKLRHKGIDIFPTFDTFNYVEESTQKYWILERHVYYCMALVAFGYEFLASKWNINGGLRKIFFQIREIESNKFKVVYVDEWKSFLIQTTEEDWDLDMTPIKGIPFAADFYQTYQVSANCKTKRHVDATRYETAYAVYELLCAFRPLSFTYFEIPVMEEEEEEEESIVETPVVASKIKKSPK